MRRTTTSNLDGDHRRHSPFRTPDWRWSAAEAHAGAGRSPEPWEDPAIGDATRYCRARIDADAEAGRESVGRRWPDLAVAHDTFVADDARRGEIEARLLAGEALGVIAVKTERAAGVVEAYERYFFNVVDALHATDWLLAHAVGVRPGAGRPPTEWDCWRYLGLAGGPLLVDLLVADHLGRAEPACPDRHLLAERARYLVREYAADWSCRPAAAAVIGEGCRLFAHCHGGRDDESRSVAAHMAFLRGAYGLARTTRPPRRRDGEKTVPTLSDTSGRAIAHHPKKERTVEPD